MILARIKLRVAALIGVVVSLPLAAQVTSPYAGQELRPIKALSDSEVTALLNGEGLGFAKAAELNRYPGPRHALDLAAQLELTEDQRAAINRVRDSMRTAAVRLGREIVERERSLDSLFAERRIDEATLSARVADIARLTGALRTVHLEAHLAVTRLLTPQQVERYQTLRGYGGHDAHRH